jgi:hypothetical protein
MKRFFWFLILLIPLLLLASTIGHQTSWANEQQATLLCTVPGSYGTIQAAVDDPACRQINVGAGIFTENVLIGRTVTILGQGAAATTVDGIGRGHVFNIQASTELDHSVAMTVTISGLEIVNGDYGVYAESENTDWNPDYGSANLHVYVSHSAIRNNASGGIRAYPHDLGQTQLHISASEIDGNLGPGIANSPGPIGLANLELLKSVVSHNMGDGILNVGCGHGLCNAELEVIASTISGNSGSGIYNSDLATVTNSTISGNVADHGGGTYSCRTTTLNNSTISGNSGGGLYIVGDVMPYGCDGLVIASNSIVANSVGGPDCSLYLVEEPWGATFSDAGHNIVEDGTCIEAPNSSSGAPRLGPLAQNGGPTLTHALLPGSPAIDAGDDGACPETDQRGRLRPEDGDRDGTATCDIGSVEARPVQEYTDLPSFTAAAGGHLNAITFEDLPAGTIVTDQYLDVGALFVDGNDTVVSSPSFVTDGMGVAGFSQVHLQLTRPAVAIGAGFPGAMMIQLYDQPGGTLLYTSPLFGSLGWGFFGGVVTDTPFTYVVFHDWLLFDVRLDNIHITKTEFRTFLPMAAKHTGN